MKLTIGMATYQDFGGVFFTVQALRLYQDCAGVEILVVDNAGCDRTESFCRKAGIHYRRFTEIQGTAAPRDKVFEWATGSHVLCLDSHVLLAPGAVARLKQFYEDHPDSLDLYHGPLYNDSLDASNAATELSNQWSAGMWGRWVSRACPDESTPFEIGSHGMGLFSCSKAAWLGFHPQARGFGGEEGYIHAKFRKAGRRCWCLPWLKWLHRFNQPGQVAYQVTNEDKFRNHLLGFLEVGLDPRPLLDHFRTLLPESVFLRISTEVLRDCNLPVPTPPLAAPTGMSSQKYAPGPTGATDRKARPPRGKRTNPKVSCIMCTYGRGHLAHRPLDEAVESFLRQTYANRELLIFNDTPGQQLTFDHPLVRVVNLDDQTSWYGRKINTAIQMTDGDLVAVWDDDDIHLPHRLELLVEGLKDYECVTPARTWYQNGPAPIIPGYCGFHFGLYTRESFEMAGGYPNDSDVTADQKMAARLHRRIVHLNPALFVSVYRWNQGHTHFSWYPESISHARMAAAPYERGCFEIRPTWLRDYEAEAAAAAARGEPPPRES